MSHLPEDKVSIVIVTYNALDYVSTCVESILANTHPAHEIIIVDNASDNPTRDYVTSLRKHSNIKLILNTENKLWCPANNQGIKEADPDSHFYLLLNSDIEVFKPNWIERLQLPFHTYPNVGITGTQYNFSHIKPTYGAIDGCCFMFRKELIDSIGYLDEHYPWNGAPYVFTVSAWSNGWTYYHVNEPDLLIHYGKRSRIFNKARSTNVKINKFEITREGGLKPGNDYIAYGLNRFGLFNINRKLRSCYSKNIL